LPLRGTGQPPQKVEGVPIVSNGFRSRVKRPRPFRRLERVGQSLLPVLSQPPVMREQRGSICRGRRLCFEKQRKPPVECLALVPEDARVSGLLGECMLEEVLPLGCVRPLAQELGA